MNKYSFHSLSKSLLGFTAALLLSPLMLAPAQAQNINTSNVGGVSFGANGPQGFLNFPSSGPGFAVGGAAAGATPADYSLGATGEQTHNNGYTGREAIRADGDYGPNPTAMMNPIAGPGSNFGLMQTQTGLLAPGTVNPARLPVTYSDSGHLNYGFTGGGGGSYGTMYGSGGLGGLLNGLLPGVFGSGRQALPAVSTGSVDINILP